MFKILYSAGNRVGAGEILRRFLLSKPNCIIKTAAYIKSSYNIQFIDWTLDALIDESMVTGNNLDKKDLIKLFDHDYLPNLIAKQAALLIEEVSAYAPDLIICDGEPILAHIAKSLNIELWYVSPLHLLNGIKWNFPGCHYFYYLENQRVAMDTWPKADKTFIYSPFAWFGLKLKKGFQWICPDVIANNDPFIDATFISTDHERIKDITNIVNCFNSNIKLNYINSKWLFTSGETSVISDGINSGVGRIAVAPRIDDPELLINAFLINKLRLGDDLSQIEFMDKFSINEIENSFLKPRMQYNLFPKEKTLKEEIENYVRRSNNKA